MSEFFAMGGYAFFVWSSYVISAVVLLWVALAPLRSRRTLLKQLRSQQMQQQARDQSS